MCVCVLVHVLQTLAAFGRGEWEIEGWGGVGRGHTDTHTQRLTRFPAAAWLDFGGSLIFIHQRRVTERETG